MQFLLVFIASSLLQNYVRLIIQPSLYTRGSSAEAKHGFDTMSEGGRG